MGSVLRQTAKRWVGGLKRGFLVGVFAAQACVGTSQFGLEVTSDQCRDGRDNDGDNLKDCEDPSCRGSRFCAFPDAGQDDASEPMRPPPIPSTGGSTENDGSVPPPMKDAGPTAPKDPLDASVPMDASVPVDPTPCQGPCVSATVRLRVLSATVETVDGNFIPYDIPLFYPDKERSGTGPDPYVVILLNGERVHTTSHVLDTTTPSWSEAGVRLDLSSGDLLEFEVLEYDGPESRTRRMFICSPELPAELPPTEAVMLTCDARSSQTVTALLEPVL